MSRRTSWTWRQATALFALLTQALLAAYKTAVALDWIAVSQLPGGAPTGEDWLGLVALVGLIAGIVVSFASIHRPEQIGLLTRIFLPLASAAVLVASYYGYDSYCGGRACRVSDYTDVPPWVIFVCVLAAFVAAAAASRSPRRAMAMTAVCLVMFPIVGFFVGPWH